MANKTYEEASLSKAICDGITCVPEYENAQAVLAFSIQESVLSYLRVLIGTEILNSESDDSRDCLMRLWSEIKG